MSLEVEELAAVAEAGERCCFAAGNVIAGSIVDRQHFTVGRERERLGDPVRRDGQVVDDADRAVAVVTEDVRRLPGDRAAGVVFGNRLGDLVKADDVVDRLDDVAAARRS